MGDSVFAILNQNTGKTTYYDADGFIIECPKTEHGPMIKQTDNAFERIEKKVDALAERVRMLVEGMTECAKLDTEIINRLNR